MTLVISASSALKNPLPDTPSIPDITSDLYFDFNAADLALADGATVNNWVGQGSAPIANRTLNTHNSISSWAFPTFDADGGPGGTPTVRFNGTNQRLRTTDANVTPYIGNYTVAVVVSGEIPTGGSSSNARWWGSSNDTQGLVQLSMSPSFAGNIYCIIPGTVILSIPLTAGHHIVVCALSADRLAGLTEDMGSPASIVPPSYAPQYTGFGIGGASAANPVSPLNGTVSRIKMYTRMLNDASLKALVESMQAEYGIV